jgi:hypothetical protein
VAEGWRELHNVEIRNLYPSPNIIKVIKSRNMRWAGNVASMGCMRNSYHILVGKPEGKNYLEDLDVDEKIISEGMLEKEGGKVWTGCIWLRKGSCGQLL